MVPRSAPPLSWRAVSHCRDSGWPERRRSGYRETIEAEATTCCEWAGWEVSQGARCRQICRMFGSDAERSQECVRWGQCSFVSFFRILTWCDSIFKAIVAALEPPVVKSGKKKCLIFWRNCLLRPSVLHSHLLRYTLMVHDTYISNFFVFLFISSSLPSHAHTIRS
jgi:hypothetical protein